MDKSKFKWHKIIIIWILVTIAITAIFPFYFMITSSFKTKSEYYVNYFGLPQELSFSKYESLFNRFDVLRMVSNSLIVTVTSVVILVVLVSLAAFIFAKFPYKGSKRITSLIVACMMVPPIVLILPVYQMMAQLNLINNYLSVIIFYVTTSMPFSLYLMVANMKSIPDDCIESARIDGAGLFNIYYRIALPLVKPAILTIITLHFLWFWNEFLFSMLFLQTNELRTLTVGVGTVVGRYTSDMPLLFTGLLVNAIPVLILFIIAQKHLVRGLVAGSTKG